MCVPALLDLGAGLRCCFVRSIWTSAVKPHGVLHTSSCRLHKKAEMFFPALMYPRLGRAKTEYSAPRALPVPLRLSNVTEIDVILGSGTARSTPICPNRVCPPTKTAR